MVSQVGACSLSLASKTTAVTSHECHGHSYHQQLDSMFSNLSKLTTKKTSTLLALWEGNASVTDGLPSQRGSDVLPCHDFIVTLHYHIGPRQNRRHFANDIFKCIFFNENVLIPIQISLIFVPKGPINNIPALVQMMAWRRPGDKSLSEPMMPRLPTHICVTQPQWVMACYNHDHDNIDLQLIN